jgi:hypothetical protein
VLIFIIFEDTKTKPAFNLNSHVMRKLLILLILFTYYQGELYSQSCLPEGYIVHTQSQIDWFPIDYPGCKRIEGDLYINDLSYPGYIYDLNGFDELTSIGGSLTIEYCDHLANLDGLNNIISIGGDLVILSNIHIIDLTALGNLQAIGGKLKIGDNANMLSFSGLDNLVSVGSRVEISSSNNINMTGLESLVSIGEDLIIIGNQNLITLTGLDSLSYIGGDLVIDVNFDLQNLNGLEELTTIVGSLFLGRDGGCWSLASLEGLANLVSVGKDINIYYTGLSCLSELVSLNSASIHNLSITYNNFLSDCEAQWMCEYLASPNGRIEVHNNGQGCNTLPEIAGSCGIDLPCLPYGDYYFQSQADIDSFQTDFPECLNLEGDLIIDGEDITDLNGLNSVIFIEGNLIIQGSYESSYNGSLEYLSGLTCLEKIGNSLKILDNGQLKCITGLNLLDSVGKDLEIINNNNLVKVNGFENLQDILGNLIINSNYNLRGLSGLTNLLSVSDDISVRFNYSLPDLHWMENLTSIHGSLIIESNDSLSDLSGLNNLTSIDSILKIIDNDRLNDLTGLEYLQIIDDGLDISGNDNLKTLNGLQGLGTINGFLWVTYNHSLYDLTTLINLSSIKNWLQINFNDSLKSLNGLESLDAESISRLYIQGNISLSECDVASICNFLSGNIGEVYIDSNHPGCNSEDEVIAACTVGITESKVNSQQSAVRIYPNPSSNQITVETTKTTPKFQISIFNLNGQEVISKKITASNTSIDISFLPQGLYFVKYCSDDTVTVLKFVKE